MRLFVAGLLVLALLALHGGTRGAPAKKEDPAATDLAKLEGTWQIVGYVRDGDELAPAEVKLLGTITFKGKDYAFHDGESGKILRIDPAKKPREIDYEGTDSEGKAHKQYAIYELDGDTFRDCISLDPDKRPTKFEAKAGSGYILVTYKRVKKKDD